MICYRLATANWILFLHALGNVSVSAASVRLSKLSFFNKHDGNQDLKL